MKRRPRAARSNTVFHKRPGPPFGLPPLECVAVPEVRAFVALVHDMAATLSALEQLGRSGQKLDVPIETDGALFVLSSFYTSAFAERFPVLSAHAAGSLEAHAAQGTRGLDAIRDDMRQVQAASRAASAMQAQFYRFCIADLRLRDEVVPVLRELMRRLEQQVTD